MLYPLSYEGEVGSIPLGFFRSVWAPSVCVGATRRMCPRDEHRDGKEPTEPSGDVEANILTSNPEWAGVGQRAEEFTDIRVLRDNLGTIEGIERSITPGGRAHVR